MYRQVPGYLEAVLEKTLSRPGFVLQDLVVIIESIETLIYDESLYSMQQAYSLNKLSIFDIRNNGQSLQELLTSYF